MRAAITERQRQSYLAAMGIQPWFPRFKLPHARPSEPCEWTWEESDSSTSTNVAPVSSQPESSEGHSYAQQTHSSPQTGSALRPSTTSTGGALPKESSDILSDLGQGKRQSTQEATAAKDILKDIPVESVPAEPFRIAAIDINEQCLAVADLPWSGLNQFTGYHERLLRNILLALGIKPSETWRTGTFAWPVTEEAALADKRYAREALQGFLDNQYGLSRRKIVLLLGHTSCLHLWSQSKEFDECRGYQSRDDIHFGVTCSLGEMMSLPDLKAEAWHDLAPLGKHL